MQEIHPFVDALDKKIRNYNKKLKYINELILKKKDGEVLKTEQDDKIN